MSSFLGCLVGAASTANAQAPLPGSQSVSEAGATKTSNSGVVNTYFGSVTKSPPKACHARFLTEAKDAISRKSPIPLIDFLSFGTDAPCATYLLLSSNQFQAMRTSLQGKTIQAVEQDIERRAAKEVKAIAQQSGSSSGTGGSTNLTSKGLTAKVLSIASEYGALTQSVSNQTTTVQGSVAGIPLVLMDKGYLAECSTRILSVTPCFSHGVMDQLSRISYSVSFATTPSVGTVTGTATGAASGTAQQVTVKTSDHSVNQFSFKWVAIRGIVSDTAMAKTAAAISKTGTGKALVDAQAKLVALENDSNNPKAVAWETNFAQQLLAEIQSGGNSSAAIESVFNKWREAGTAMASAFGLPENIDQASTGPSVPDSVSGAVELAHAYTQYLGAEEDQGLSAIIAQPPILSFEYDDNRSSSQPSDSVFRAIYQQKWTPLTLTVNGALSIYNSGQSAVPGAGRLRDAQFATEAAHSFALNTPLSSSLGVTLSGAFYYQYQSSPAILNVTPGAPVDGVTFTGLPSTAAQVYGKTGNIAIGQLKLSVGSGSSVTVPLSVTYSNRTELITSPTWKAQVGVSYDFDSLFSGNK